MSKRKHAKSAHPQRRNFPSDYTREDLIAQLVAMGAECYRQAEQIEALTQRIYELEAENSLLPESEQHGVDGEMDVNGYRLCASDFLSRFDSIGLGEQGGYSCVAGRGDDVESTFGRDISAAPDMEPADIRLGDSVRVPVRWPLADSAPRPVFRVFDMSM
ncbi:hypothetical protein [Burkholderia gladioli]|uniref:hypothetical protein n=1 Tax=Burkholderia gladioli TaxID=28095 RepID=UPI001641DC6B|nr:hypothetical protein [Burkholderia gladioli]